METTVACWGYIGKNDKNMKTTVECWGHIGNNGKEHGNYCSMLGLYREYCNGKEHGNTILGLSDPETALTAMPNPWARCEFPGPGQINASHIMSYSLNSLRVILGSIIGLIKGGTLGVQTITHMCYSLNSKYPPLINQMERKMDNEMETGIILGVIGVTVSPIIVKNEMENEMETWIIYRIIGAIV